ncbi:MAG: peptidase S9 [Gemmatimonadota bacterium]|nr:peptidase S9 [Gemmatimonadota bacterium]MDH3476743.1 peptidase S9 [Gemmatimonadota bacterium]
MWDIRRLGLAALATLLGLGGAVQTAEAQYFGRNKVQYEDFDFKIVKTEHFDIYYYDEEQQGIEYAVLMAERWYARLSRVLNHDLSNRQALILYASAPHFRQTNTLQGDLGEATGGVTEILKRRIVLPFAGPLPETDHVIGHELVHAFQFDITGEGGGIALAGIPTVMRFPLWFVEGMAEYLSIGPRDPNTAMWMRDAVKTGLPSASKLANPKYFPYRYGHSLWAYVAGRWGDDAVGRILKASRTSSSPAMAFSRVLGVSPDSAVAGWHRALQETYAPLTDQTSPAADYGRPLITKELNGGRLNVSPALSPDGTKLVYLSERDLFSIDMFLADVETGSIIRKITKTAVDPHFESIQFINSAGAWDWDGQRFVLAAIAKGRPVITITNIETGKIDREVRLEDIGEVFNPAWSPDGRYIAFSGLADGLSDLFVFDLEGSELRRLTNDGYAELQPAWSPDGRSIAVVTDRFSAGLSSLLYGNYGLALVDPMTGDMRPIEAFERGKHISPQWSPNGESLYFVSDQSGISNVYRLHLESGELFQITNLYTGVSGITSLSPTLSVAARTGQIAMSVYQDDMHAIYYLDRPEVLEGGPVRGAFEGLEDPALLPPVDRLTDDVASIIANAFYGLPRDTVTYARDPYRTRFALDYIGQPSLAVGADSYGTYIAGGASLFWSDMLGNHNLATALQVQGSFKDIAALVGYTNLTRRLNWGVAFQQIPYLTGFVNYGQGSFNGQPVLVEQQVLFRQTNRSLGGMAAYPLSRPQRIEVSAGVLNVTYDIEEKLRAISQTGQLVIDSTTSLPAPDAINLAQTSVALVYDNSLWGVASPLLGQRYRLEVGANVGTIDFFDAVADYRKYFMPARPFTVAARLMHFGRYGRDAEDSNRLQPLFLGYDGLVRGYDYGSFDFFEECNDDGTCPNYTNLLGSKMLVGNLELRFPPFGLLGIGGGLFGFLPIEMVIFGDAGLAWWGAGDVTDPAERDLLRPFFLGGERTPVYSAGTGLRMNVFGFMIIELDYVYPFSRERGGHLQFSFTPGF